MFQEQTALVARAHAETRGLVEIALNAARPEHTGILIRIASRASPAGAARTATREYATLKVIVAITHTASAEILVLVTVNVEISGLVQSAKHANLV